MFLQNILCIDAYLFWLLVYKNIWDGMRVTILSFVYTRPFVFKSKILYWYSYLLAAVCLLELFGIRSWSSNLLLGSMFYFLELRCCLIFWIKEWMAPLPHKKEKQRKRGWGELWTFSMITGEHYAWYFGCWEIHVQLTVRAQIALSSPPKQIQLLKLFSATTVLMCAMFLIYKHNWWGAK